MVQDSLMYWGIMRKRSKNSRKITIIAIILLIAIVLAILIMPKPTTEPVKKSVREPVFAGSWYPGTKEALNKTIDGYFKNINKLDLNGTIKAIIVPHAGYPYSGEVAATAFKQLGKYETVFVLGPSHRIPLEGAALTNYTHFKTPLGEIKISKKQLIGKNIVINEKAHAQEHSIELELPLLQKSVGDFELVPIVVGDIDTKELKDALLRNLSDKDLFVVSADLSHFHNYTDALKLDSYTIDKILNLDDKNIFNAEIDAPWAVSTLLLIAKEKGWKPHLVYYANSGDVTGDKSSVVGYSAIAFVEEKEVYTNSEKEFMLNLARDTIKTYLTTGKKPKIELTNLTNSLKETKACFVTLNKDGELRGCIGNLEASEPLYQCIINNAINAAVNDPRFPEVKISELQDIEIEISVLTDPKKLDYSTTEDMLNRLRPNIDGVILRKGFRQATFLPQVWEQLPIKEEFLGNLCMKAGLNRDCFKEDPEISTYQAIVFHEK